MIDVKKSPTSDEADSLSGAIALCSAHVVQISHDGTIEKAQGSTLT